jgi:hypothetical protein
MSLRNGAGLVSAVTETKARKSNGTRQRREPSSRHFPVRKVIRAELIGSDICTALGITSRSSTPVLALCRALVEAGHHPATPLEAYRGDVLCLRVRAIGEGAALAINDEGTGFRPYGKPVAASPMRQNEEGGL